MIFYSDIDDTLMQAGIPSDNLKIFLNNINSSKHVFVPCSGRPSSNMINTFSKFDSPYIIGFNGGEIFDLQENKVIYKNSVTKEEVEEVAKYLISNGLNYVLYDEKQLYTNDNSNEYANVEKNLNLLELVETDDIIESVKVLGLADPEVIDNYIEEMKELFPNLEITKSKPFFIEITKKGVTKGEAIKKMNELFNVDTEDVYIFGDSNNDISMFKLPATKVAVKNANDTILSLADYVCDSCENDGVVKYIDELLKGDYES